MILGLKAWFSFRNKENSHLFKFIFQTSINVSSKVDAAFDVDLVIEELLR